MANDWLTEFAKMLKERENKPSPSITTGKVIQPLPEVKIQLNEHIVLDKNNLIIFEHVYLHYAYSDPLHYLNVGDEVCLFPTQDEQTYFLLDKVRRLN